MALIGPRTVPGQRRAPFRAAVGPRRFQQRFRTAVQRDKFRRDKTGHGQVTGPSGLLGVSYPE